MNEGIKNTNVMDNKIRDPFLLCEKNWFDYYFVMLTIPNITLILFLSFCTLLKTYRRVILNFVLCCQ